MGHKARCYSLSSEIGIVHSSKVAHIFCVIDPVIFCISIVFFCLEAVCHGNDPPALPQPLLADSHVLYNA